MKNKFQALLMIGCLTGFVMAVGFLDVPRAQAAEVHLNNSITKPYYLNQPGATYILDEDISAEGTALVIDADGITVDLNGHKIIFGNTNVSVPNFDFEQGNGTVPSNWNLSLAPHASRVSTSEWPMIGNWTMKFTSPTAGEDIVSDWINITNPNRTYQAYVQMSSKKAILVKVEYQDGRIINPDYTNPQVDTSTITFKPSSLGWGAGQYRLHLMLNPAVTPGGTFYVDYGDIRPARDVGINGFPWAGGLIPDLPTAPGNHRNIIIKNGSIIEGNAGYAFRAISHTGVGLEITNVYTKITGGDSGTFYGYGGANQNIHNNIFENPKVYVVNRMDLSNYDILTGNNITFYNNNTSFSGGGISISGDSTSTNIYNNTFSNNSIMTNHYSVTSYANPGHTVTGIKIYNNKFLGASAVFFSSNSIGNEVNNNYFNLESEPCNTEYQTQIYTTGIRVYDYDSPTASTYNNIIRDNLIEGKVHFFSQFPGCRPGVSGIKTATGPLSPNEFYRNEIHVYREDTNSEAIAFSALGSNLNGIRDNYLGSNHFNIIYGDRFAALADNGIFTNNTIVKGGPTIGVNEYFPISAWWCCKTGVMSNHQYIGSKVIDTSLFNFGYSLGAQDGIIEHDIRWYLNLKVLDANKASVEGATVTINDKGGQQVFSGTTDSQGNIKNIDLRQTIQTFQIKYRTKTEAIYTPHQIVISKNGLPTETKTLTMDANKNMTVILDGQDSEAAIISNPAVRIDRANETVTVSWTTDKPTSSTLKWGLDTNYGQTLNNSSLTTSHTMTIANIRPNNYHFEVSGADSSGLSSQSFDQTFFYLSDVPSGVKLIKSVDKNSASSGEILTYTINYTNTLPIAISSVRIEDLIPNGTTYVADSASNGGTFSSGKLIWTIGDVAANGSGTVTFQVIAQ